MACGSDDGRVYIYCSDSGLLLRTLEADEDIVNCIQAHPQCAMLATSGIENVVRLWSPSPDGPSTQQIEKLKDLVHENQVDGMFSVCVCVCACVCVCVCVF